MYHAYRLDQKAKAVHFTFRNETGNVLWSTWNLQWVLKNMYLNTTKKSNRISRKRMDDILSWRRVG